MKPIIVKCIVFIVRAVLTFILCAAIFHSCTTYKKCVQKFGNLKADTVEVLKIDTLPSIETVRTEIRHLPGERVIIKDSIPCPELINKKFSSKSTKGTVQTDVEIKDNKITVDCKADSLLHELEIRDRQITILESKVKTITNQTQFVDSRTWWQKIPWYLWIPFSIIGLIVLILIIKKIFS